MRKFLLLCSVLSVVGCATIVNDPTVPVAFAFSDGTDGNCTFRNKRGMWTANVPSTVQIRRSDDALIYDCNTKDGRRAQGRVESEIEAAKLGASVLFIDFGITDAITDKHRKYTGTFIIPVPAASK